AQAPALPPEAKAIIEQTLAQYFPTYVPDATPQSEERHKDAPVPNQQGNTASGNTNNNGADDPTTKTVSVVVPGEKPGDATKTVQVTYTKFNSPPVITVNHVTD